MDLFLTATLTLALFAGMSISIVGVGLLGLRVLFREWKTGEKLRADAVLLHLKAKDHELAMARERLEVLQKLSVLNPKVAENSQPFYISDDASQAALEKRMLSGGSELSADEVDGLGL